MTTENRRLRYCRLRRHRFVELCLFWSSFAGYVDGYSTWSIISAAFSCSALTTVDCLLSELWGVKAVNVTSMAVRWLHPSHGARSTLSLVGLSTTLPLRTFYNAIHSDKWSEFMYSLLYSKHVRRRVVGFKLWFIVFFWSSPLTVSW